MPNSILLCIDQNHYSTNDKAYEVIVIPWYIDGREWSYQWRFLDNDIPFAKYGFPKNCGKKIYGIDSISTSFPYIICCEGVFDSLWVKKWYCSWW